MHALPKTDTATELTDLVNKTAHEFTSLSDSYWSDKPLADKWSRKEILGHLIDSAVNNLRRFCESQYAEIEPYVIQKYEQEHLVKTNDYQNLPVEHLIRLWTNLNTHIAYVLRSMPPVKREVRVLTPEGNIETLGWLAEDYVIHMQHHLDQIFDPH